jgi:plasmid stabilization system protein ParE
MTFVVVVTERAARDMEETAAWWARERSAEQAELWYAGIRRALTTLTEHPERCAVAPEQPDFAYPLRELHYGVGSRPTHRAVSSGELKRFFRNVGD